MVGFCGFACVQAWTIVSIMAENGQVSITAGIPMTVPYLAFVVGFGSMVVATIAVAFVPEDTPFPTVAGTTTQASEVQL